MELRAAHASELPELLRLHRAAFGEEGAVIAKLVEEFQQDGSGQLLSLVASEDGLLGHVIFSQIQLAHLRAAILAPLAVLPKRQKQGVGSQLVKRGLEQLQKDGLELVFVFGNPGYYSRFGFRPALEHGFEPAHPIKAEHEAGWMVLFFKESAGDGVKGKVQCAGPLDKAELW
ncbi:unnamed protein product [Effrenium voratum]|uniref:N-acetyltransferase domain-containing protein n=1 Tax=Effrenium voratum TaxID=2562239 RepID=A0AA36ICV3_9DINO|nr:unnamed protein product [Effrenium voratum]CAJ1462132.1 unnamed protein product [Effrenium voratum]